MKSRTNVDWYLFAGANMVSSVNYIIIKSNLQRGLLRTPYQSAKLALGKDDNTLRHGDYKIFHDVRFRTRKA